MTDADPELQVEKQKIWEFQEVLSLRNGSVVLMEDVEMFGQLVEEYDLRFMTPLGWVGAPENCSTVGHKRIHPFPRQLAGQMVYAIGLTIKKLVTNETTLNLRQVSVYDWSEAAYQELV